ncbi:MAG: P1 family peptidase [Ktedonobacterales bacterium]
MMTLPTSHSDDICDVPGVLVGHDTQLDAGTGCTVLLFEHPALGAVDVRGGAPATRETDLLDPRCMMREVHAVVLAGGSAYGLDAASGVMRYLEERGAGFDTGVARVPIVPAAALFDLALGRADIRPDAAAGRRAAEAAQSGPVAQGSVGAGTGATVGKMAGPLYVTKSGLGSASLALPVGSIVVGALAAVNAVGDVYDEATGQLLAGARRPDGNGWLNASGSASTGATQAPGASDARLFPGAQTTLAVVATNAACSKADLAKIAGMAHDGLARAIRPVHTPFDGDIVFALSTADGPEAGQPASPMMVGMLGAAGATALARAVVNAVRAATSLHGIPALRDLPLTM